MSDAGVAFLKRHEGRSLKAYDDGTGVWTIGYGHTGDVKKGDTLTPHQVDELLRFDLEKFEEGVERLFPAGYLKQCEFDALVSLAFNIGLGNLANSTLRRTLLSDKPRAAVADWFLVWRKAGGEVMRGLVKRREEERALFLGEAK